MDAAIPPYARIAAQLRARIAQGELAAGDLLPSTRELTREFGVAIATATKALAVLRQEGLTRPVPGVGTVVCATGGPRAGGRSAAPARRAGSAGSSGPVGSAGSSGPVGSSGSDVPPMLSRERVVAAAVAVADAEGIEAVSMRRIGAELGTAPMSLYRHVATKDELLMQMIDAVLAAHPLPADPLPGWRERLSLAGRELWAVFRRHPWLAPTMSLTRPQPLPAAIAYTEWVLDALDGLGLEPREAFDLHVMLFAYVRGMAVNLEAEAAAEAATGQTGDEWMDGQLETLRDLAVERSLRHFPKLLAVDYDLDLDGLFERGLDLLLDGLAVRLERRAR